MTIRTFQAAWGILLCTVWAGSHAMGDAHHDLAKDMATQVYGVPYDPSKVKREVDRQADDKTTATAGPGTTAAAPCEPDQRERPADKACPSPQQP